MSTTHFPYDESSYQVHQADSKFSICGLCGTKVTKKTRVALWKGVTIVGSRYVAKYLCNRGKGTSCCYQIIFPYKKQGYNIFKREEIDGKVSLRMWKAEGLVDFQTNTWTFSKILEHSMYYFYKVKWNDGSITWEPECNIDDDSYLKRYKKKRKLNVELPALKEPNRSVVHSRLIQMNDVEVSDEDEEDSDSSYEGEDNDSSDILQEDADEQVLETESDEDREEKGDCDESEENNGDDESQEDGTDDDGEEDEEDEGESEDEETEGGKEDNGEEDEEDNGKEDEEVEGGKEHNGEEDEEDEGESED